MTIRLVDSGWSAELVNAIHADSTALRIISPFIKLAALERLLSQRPMKVQVITRFNLADFADGVSDIPALRHILECGGKVRGIKNLHSKVYLFGSSRAIVTSANLTSAALDRNQEFGIVSQDSSNIASCQQYFERLWKLGRADLTLKQLAAWNETVTRHRASAKPPSDSKKLGDFGAEAGIVASATTAFPDVIADAGQAFVKFLGEGGSRAPLSRSTIDEVKSSGCHWAVAYPASKRPTGVRDDAVIFVGRLTQDPPDIRIFGRAIGMKHVPGRDDATSEDITHRHWKQMWSRYIRVYKGEFVAGNLNNGVSLNELMSTLGVDSFLSTQRNAEKGEGNTNPRNAYKQQAAVALSYEGRSWLAQHLQAAFDKHGTIVSVRKSAPW